MRVVTLIDSSGKEISISFPEEVTLNGDPESGGYKQCVLECHAILDALEIPSAAGVSCPDPDCNSALGHRLRDLRDRYLNAKNPKKEH